MEIQGDPAAPRLRVSQPEAASQARGEGAPYLISVRLTAPTVAAIELIAEDAWVALADYPKTGEAQIAETTINGSG